MCNISLNFLISAAKPELQQTKSFYFSITFSTVNLLHTTTKHTTILLKTPTSEDTKAISETIIGI